MRNKVKSEEDTLERAAKKRATNKQVDSTYLVIWRLLQILEMDPEPCTLHPLHEYNDKYKK